MSVEPTTTEDKVILDRANLERLADLLEEGSVSILRAAGADAMANGAQAVIDSVRRIAMRMPTVTPRDPVDDLAAVVALEAFERIVAGRGRFEDRALVRTALGGKP